jgi:putative ABC transport system permease protein
VIAMRASPGASASTANGSWVLNRFGERRGVSLAWRNVVHDRGRLMRATAGIAFAVLLMMMQLGFRNAFLDSALDIVRSIDGDIIITSATKFRFGNKDPFSRRQLYAAAAVEGVDTVRPIYLDSSIWRNPQTGKNYEIQILAFDPDRPVFAIAEIAANLQALKQPDTMLWDSRARRFQGDAQEGTVSEVARRHIRVIGTFPRGPDFTTDATVVMSDRNFMKFASDHRLRANELPDIELGVVKVRPGFDVNAVKANLQNALSPIVTVRTKPELVALEEQFQNGVSPVGPIFHLGAAIGFVVGMMICYQILQTDIGDLLPQYATLKAMGYNNGYLLRAVLEQGALYALIGFIPACAVSAVVYAVIGEIALLPLRLTASILTTCAILTVIMCLVSGLIASRPLLRVDPAEVF